MMTNSKKSIVAVVAFFVSASAVDADRINVVKEELTRAEANELGIVISEEQIQWVDEHGRMGAKGATVNAIRYRMNLPMLLNGQQVGGGDFETTDDCTILSQSADIDTEDDYSAYTRFNMEHVVNADCQGKASYWADFGSHPIRIFWIHLD